MRRAVGILAIAIAPVFAAGLAAAESGYGSGASGAASGAAGAAGSAASSAAGFMGQHTMTGRITSIDKDEGKLSIDSEGKEMTVHFPRTALQNLNEGDRVTVQLAIKPASGAAGTSGTGRSGSGTGAGGPGGGMGGGTPGGAGRPESETR